MRATTPYFFCLTLGAVGPIAEAEPVRLTKSQMDTVTAGAVSVSAAASAVAISDHTYTEANTETHARSGRFFEWGFGRAMAFACCGRQSDANVSLSAFADGPIVAMVSRAIKHSSPRYSDERGYIYIVSINPTAPRLLRRPRSIKLLPWALSPALARLIRPLDARAALALGMGVTNADESLTLTGAQMDAATGGGVSFEVFTRSSTTSISSSTYGP